MGASMFQAVVIPTNGEIREQSLPEGEGERIQALQGIVGGMLETIPMPEGRYFLLDEDGKLKGLKPNPMATYMAREARAISADDYIAGDVALVEAKVLE